MSQRLRKDERELDADEESWFNDDSDENRVSTLNHGSLFNGGSDDEDSQPEMTGTSNAITSSGPVRPHRHLLEHDDDNVSTGNSFSKLTDPMSADEQ
jgi:hypothetical protein